MQGDIPGWPVEFPTHLTTGQHWFCPNPPVGIVSFPLSMTICPNTGLGRTGGQGIPTTPHLFLCPSPYPTHPLFLEETHQWQSPTMGQPSATWGPIGTYLWG